MVNSPSNIIISYFPEKLSFCQILNLCGFVFIGFEKIARKKSFSFNFSKLNLTFFLIVNSNPIFPHWFLRTSLAILGFCLIRRIVFPTNFLNWLDSFIFPMFYFITLNIQFVSTQIQWKKSKGCKTGNIQFCISCSDRSDYIVSSDYVSLTARGVNTLMFCK